MNDSQSQLWMGNVRKNYNFLSNVFIYILECIEIFIQLEPYMTDSFVMDAFLKMGEDPRSVRLMRSKYTGDLAGYCFVTFASPDQAIHVMHKLNGKPIPGTNPIVRFRLNAASNTNSKSDKFEREFSVWVGDLSSDVDDYSLYRVFSNRFTSIKAAKVVLDSSGFSKGYGFVRFSLEDEKCQALERMNGYVGLGTKALRLCDAVTKPKIGGMVPHIFPWAIIGLSIAMSLKFQATIRAIQRVQVSIPLRITINTIIHNTMIRPHTGRQQLPHTVRPH